MISMDQEKAFNHSTGNFSTVMQKLNFGEGIRKWVHLLYTDINCIAKNKMIKLTRGTQQDCPYPHSHTF